MSAPDKLVGTSASPRDIQDQLTADWDDVDDSDCSSHSSSSPMPSGDQKDSSPPSRDTSEPDRDDSGESARAQSGPSDALSAMDVNIIREVGRLLAEVESTAKPGETADFLYHVSNGAVEVSGPTNSAALYQRLLDAVPKLKIVQGVKSVDIGGVRRP